MARREQIVPAQRLHARAGSGHAERPHGRLHARRKAARARLVGVLSILGIFLITLVFIGLWQPQVRVSHITLSSGGTTVQVVQNALAGSYFGIVPRSSIFFFSAARVRAAVLDANHTIAAVSVVRTGFDSISVTPDPRSALARWCGIPRAQGSADTIAQDVATSTIGTCYFFDSTGFLYASTSAPIIASTLSSSPSATGASTNISSFSTSTDGSSKSAVTLMSNNIPLTSYLVYAALVASSSPPFLNTIANVTKLPALFDFARHIHVFGAKVVAIVIRSDEVDLFLAHGTRITYVLGDEQEADALLTAVKNKISLINGSLVYVDLRFPNKVYFLKRGAGRK